MEQAVKVFGSLLLDISFRAPSLTYVREGVFLRHKVFIEFGFDFFPETFQ